MAPLVPNKIQCNGCSQEITDKQYLRCHVCCKYYDLPCTNVSEKRFYIMSADNKKNWKCQECRSNEPKTDNTNTPIKHNLQLSPNSNQDIGRTNVTLRSRTNEKLKSTAISTSASSTPDLPTSDLANELKLLRQDIKEMRNDMQEFRGTMTNLLTAINACNQRLDCLEARMEVVEKNSQIKTSNDISFFEKTITDLKIELNDRDQELLSNDIEVSGIPEDKNERSTHIVLAVATKLGVALEDRDIVSAERAGLSRREQNETSRPRPIVVRLARRVHRDSLLAAARVRRSCTTVGLGLNSVDCHFYVNERLTRHNRQLFYKVRTEAKRNNWKYVWTRQGKVFARRKNGEPSHRVRFESDLIIVFGQ